MKYLIKYGIPVAIAAGVVWAANNVEPVKKILGAKAAA